MQPASIINGGDEGRAAPTPAAPTPVPSALPSRIGKYDVRGEIGKGTLVKVFRAQDTDIGRPVILKILAGSRDRRLIELFRREVMAAARLRHRNLITIYELGEHAGMPFAAMQDPEGCELRTSMAPGALTLLQKAGIMSQVAEGLQTAHQGGLAYVGVRPSGILLTGDRSVLIQDFSIVRLITEEQDEDVSYAAPEELKNGALPDALCDIFSFGVIYYELLAGVHPFRNGAPPALREAAPDCPEALERIIHRAMEPSRERRYQSVEQLLDDAEPILCELKRTRAAALLVDARRMQRSGEIEQAQGIVREMLELDPANRKAREMQAALRAEQQRRILEERLRTLFKEADEEAAARRFARAVEILHTAAQLEGAPPEAARRLDDMCARLERSQNAAELLAEARQLLVEDSLEEAQAKTAEARALDPGRSEFADLSAAIAAATERRKGESEARSLLAEARFSEALARLQALAAEFPSHATVRELLEQAAAGVKRTQTIANLRTACAALRPEGNFDKALGLVDIALADYPGDPELETLRRELDQERQAALAAAACREALQEAQWLLDQDRPHLAARFLREKSAGLPDQPELQARLQAIEQMIPAWENRRFVQDCLARAAALEQVEQWSVAMTLVEQALEASPGSVELQDAAERLRQRRREEESRKKLARRLEAIQQKIGAQSWTEALALIEAAQREFSDNAELAQRLEQAREGKRRADCDAIAAEARQYMTDGESDRAEQVLRRGMESLPGEAVLIGLWEELQSANRYRDECRRAQVLFGRRQLREAEEILAPLAAERRPEAQALLEAVRAARAASEEDDFYDQAREQALKLIMQRQFDQAADLIRNLLNLFPGDPVLERDLKTAEVGLTVEGPALEPAAAAKAEPVERVGAVPVEPVPEPPVQPQIVVAPRMESLKRTSFLPYLLWPAIGGSILLFLSTSGATIWKLSHHEAHAAAMPPKPEPIRRQPTPTPAPAIDPPAPPEEHIAAHAKVVVNPPSPRQAFTPPAFPSNADRTQAVALPPPVTERLPSRQEAPRLPAAGQIAPPAPAPKAAEKPVEKAPEPPPPPVVREPKPVSHPAPPTPQLALQRGISGEVRLEATVSPRGTIMDIKALSGDAILVAAAKAAVWKWRYEPGSINGRPIPSKVQIRILFEGRR